MACVLAIPDLHAPWEHPRALDFCRRLRDRFRPDRVVMLGDEADLHRFSRHAKDPDLPGPGDELAMAAEHLAPWFSEFPEALVCWSNHVRRMGARAADAELPRRAVREWADVIGAPAGWAYADWHLVDGVEYRHGDGFGGQYAAMKAALKLHRSVVMGHLHDQSGVWYSTVRDGPTLFGAAAGCLINVGAGCYDYGRYSPGRPTLGAVVAHDGEAAHFIPMGV